MFTPIQLDKMRNFRYGMKAVHLIEQKLGIKMSGLDMNGLSMYELSVIVWAGLAHEDKELTPDTVMELIDDHSSIPAVSEVMAKAFEVAFGEGNEPSKTAAKK